MPTQSGAVDLVAWNGGALDPPARCEYHERLISAQAGHQRDLRELIRAQGSRIDNVADMCGRLESGLLELVASQKTISDRLGEPPDPTRDFHGSGMLRVLGRIANHHIAIPVSDDRDEGEFTGLQDRRTLVRRAKHAEKSSRNATLRVVAGIIGGGGVVELVRQIVGLIGD